MARGQLVILEGPQAGSAFDFFAEAVIGRDSSADIVISDPEVSRQHASVAVTSAGATIRDLGSRNGTFVNGERIVEPRMIGEDEKVRVGMTLLELRVLAEATVLGGAPSGGEAKTSYSRPSPPRTAVSDSENALAEDATERLPDDQPPPPPPPGEADLREPPPVPYVEPEEHYDEAPAAVPFETPVEHAPAANGASEAPPEPAAQEVEPEIQAASAAPSPVASGESLDRLTDLVIRSDFDRELTGMMLYRLIDGEGGIDRAIAFAAIVAKARIAARERDARAPEG